MGWEQRSRIFHSHLFSLLCKNVGATGWRKQCLNKPQQTKRVVTSHKALESLTSTSFSVSGGALWRRKNTRVSIIQPLTKAEGNFGWPCIARKGLSRVCERTRIQNLLCPLCPLWDTNLYRGGVENIRCWGQPSRTITMNHLNSNLFICKIRIITATLCKPCKEYIYIFHRHTRVCMNMCIVCVCVNTV